MKKTANLLILILLLFSCAQPFEDLEPKNKALKAEMSFFDYYALFPTIDSLGRYKNPPWIQLYYEVDTSIIHDYNHELSVQMFKYENDSLLDTGSELLSRYVYGEKPYNEYLFWYSYGENRETFEVFRELDTVNFRFEFQGLMEGIDLKLYVRTYYDKSDTIVFNSDASFSVVIPERGGGWNDPSYIEINQIIL